MITNIYIDGFRSLRNFELQIRPGINVLVGPNGAGKTNIILFFEFLRHVFSDGVPDAVGKMGGLGSVFQKRGRSKFADRLSFVVKGRAKENENPFTYEVSGTIRAFPSTQEIGFESQSLKILLENDISYLDLNWSISKDGGEIFVEINDYPEEGPNSGVYFSRSDLKKFASSPWIQSAGLLAMLQHAVPAADLVGYDLSSRFLLNVVPSAVKGIEDSSRSPGIDSTGSGLSATLYAIKRKRMIPDVSGRFLRFYGEPRMASWGRVLSQIRVAVPSIEDIEVENDPFDNRLRVRVVIGGARKAVLPLSALSDGTVKWMSLVVRLATSKAALLLEEPENYLHPLMQQEVVRMLRDSVDEDGFVILSTHSETLLNAVRAVELIVVSYKDSSTKACRVSNVCELNEEIAKTGFGLGYYYLADAIRD